MSYFKKLLSSVIVIQLFACSLFAAETAAPKSELNLQEIALPSEVKDVGKQGGAIYYSTSVKNKVLIPVHMWGEIKESGLHFIPADTTFIKGLSLAGGPTSAARLDDVVLIRSTPAGGFKEIEFDLSKGGDASVHQFKMESGDTVFIKKDTFVENRNYYTSLVGIFLTVLSTFVIVNRIK